MQTNLLLLGIGVLVAMVAYNAWLTRRHQPRQAQPEPQDAAKAGPSQRAEPTLDLQALAGERSPQGLADKAGGLDALIDTLATISLEVPVTGDQVLAALPPTRRVGSKPFALEGFNSASQQWETPQPGQLYSQLQAGVQLANRQGALNDIEFSEFVVTTQRVSDLVGGTPDFPSMRDEVSRARELDQFASAHDAQLGLVLRARRAAWSPSYIQQMAVRHGFVPGAIPGRMYQPASTPGMPPALSLGFDTQAALDEDPTQSALRELTLGLDVAQVDRSERPFERMHELAQALARDMDGVVTDDKGMLLPPEALAQISSELEKLYDKLAERDLAAGSSLARRLFS